MKKFIYALIFLVAVSGLVFANRQIKNDSKRSITKPLCTAETEAALKWQATTAGILYKKWEGSPAGKKVYAAEAKIEKQVKEYTSMEGVVTSLTLPPGSRLGFGVMARINGEDYILRFDTEKSSENIFSLNNEFQQLRSLEVNDKIIIKSHSVTHAPKYAYPIISGEYAERNGKIIYKHAPPAKVVAKDIHNEIHTALRFVHDIYFYHFLWRTKQNNPGKR